MGQNITSHTITPNSIASNQKTMELLTSSVKEIAKNLFDAVGLNFIEENQDVFTGNVADEIIKQQSHMHSLGVVMREGQVKRTFDRKI